MRYWRGWDGGSWLRNITPTRPLGDADRERTRFAAQPPAKISRSRKRRPLWRTLKKLASGLEILW